jgi:hypothetical protein
VLNTLLDSRDEQADRTVTARLFDAEEAQIHRLILEKRVVTDPIEERESTSRFAGMRVRPPADPRACHAQCIPRE